MDFPIGYIQRAFKVYIKNYGHSYNIEVITELITRLQMKDRGKEQKIEMKEKGVQRNVQWIPFKSHMGMNEAMKLRVGDKIDYRDQVGRFLHAIIIQKNGTNLKVRYDGLSEKWDSWSDFTKELFRFAAPRSISKRPAHRFKCIKLGSYIDVNPKQMHSGWKRGEVKRLHKTSGQVLIGYHNADEAKDCLNWAHLDDETEIAPYLTKVKNYAVASNDGSALAQGIVGEPTNTEMGKAMSSELRRVKEENGKLLKANDKLEQQLRDLKRKMDALECNPERISAMNTEQLNQAKARWHKNIELIEEEERLLMENSLNCIACRDVKKNISFMDGCDHFVLCNECESKMETKKCPVCNMKYTKIKKLNV